MKPKELEEYFKSDKSDWFHIDSEGFKEWDDEKVKEFWIKIRSKKDSDYSYYIFPEFELDFARSEYLKRQKSKKNHDDANLKDFIPNHEDIATTFDKKEGLFLSKSTNFWNKGKCRVFTNDVDFSHAQFLDSTSFDFVQFQENLTFLNTIFTTIVLFLIRNI